jgi:DNA replication protein DnaC
MIKMAQLEDIRKMYFMEGLSIREIHRRTGMHRDTISKYLSMDEPLQGEYIRKKENVILVGNSGVINELIAAQQEYRLNRLEKQWLAPHLIILDELGYVPFSKMGAELLFQFCAARYERGSIIITTNLEFPKWTEVLGDEQMTAALLDRLTHKAHILNINGDSYRFKQALAMQSETT